MKIVNKRARSDYQIFDSFEAGLVLTGGEVKSLKDGRGDISNAYVRLRENEAYLVGANIPVYVNSSVKDEDPTRSRKLLLHKNEIVSLGTKTKQQNLTLVPLAVYAKGPRIKLEVGLGKGLKSFEKRDIKRKKDMDRDIEIELRGKE